MAESGMNYTPQGKPDPVVKKGEFVFSAMALDHGHIYAMSQGLMEAGAVLKSVYDPDPQKVEDFIAKFPDTKSVRSEEEIFSDPDIKLVAGAAVTSERCALGLRVLSVGKDYFTDKAPFTTLPQLEAARAKVKETGKKYMVYYSERLHVESAVFAGELIAQDAIGRVIQVLGLGPHRIGAPSLRPDWFYQRAKYGGILCDIGSHQIEQFLFYAGCKEAQVVQARAVNYNHPEYPELEDFGDANLLGDNGASNYFRVDWFTPDALDTWGDGRTFILGTKGYIELRKYTNIGSGKPGAGHVYLVNDKENRYINVEGKVGYPYFGQLILDCLNRTENAMTQEHAFKAAELCVTAQILADKAKQE
jgi:predicted dehydrogenase